MNNQLLLIIIIIVIFFIYNSTTKSVKQQFRSITNIKHPLYISGRIVGDDDSVDITQDDNIYYDRYDNFSGRGGGGGSAMHRSLGSAADLDYDGTDIVDTDAFDGDDALYMQRDSNIAYVDNEPFRGTGAFDCTNMPCRSVGAYDIFDADAAFGKFADIDGIVATGVNTVDTFTGSFDDVAINPRAIRPYTSIDPLDFGTWDVTMDKNRFAPDTDLRENDLYENFAQSRAMTNAADATDANYDMAGPASNAYEPDNNFLDMSSLNSKMARVKFIDANKIARPQPFLATLYQ